MYVFIDTPLPLYFALACNYRIASEAFNNLGRTKRPTVCYSRFPFFFRHSPTRCSSTRCEKNEGKKSVSPCRWIRVFLILLNFDNSRWREIDNCRIVQTRLFSRSTFSRPTRTVRTRFQYFAIGLMPEAQTFGLDPADSTKYFQVFHGDATFSGYHTSFFAHEEKASRYESQGSGLLDLDPRFLTLVTSRKRVETTKRLFWSLFT